MASAFISGVQSQGVGACLKHYVLNDQETRRMSVDVHVEECSLWEIYLKPFEIAIREAAAISEAVKQDMPDAQVRFARGCDLMNEDRSGFAEAVKLAADSDIRITLQPGESRQVEFIFSASQTAFIGTDMLWRVEEGDVDILLGDSSEKLVTAGTVRITDTRIMETGARS